MNRFALKSFLRHLLSATLVALAGIEWLNAPVNWKLVAATVGSAVVPVILKALDADEPDFGRGAL